MNSSYIFIFIIVDVAVAVVLIKITRYSIGILLFDENKSEKELLRMTSWNRDWIKIKETHSEKL